MIYDWYKAADDGGGYGNGVATHPKRPGYATAIGDTWGPHRTTNGGLLWSPRMLGATTRGQIYGRAVAYSLKDPNTSYVGVGGLVVAQTGTGAFCAITNGSFSLDVRSKKIGFDSDLPHGNAGDVPRATGNLIRVVLIEGVEHIYAVCRQGFAHSSDGGMSWQVTPITVSQQAWASLVVLADGSLIAASFRNATTGAASQVFHIVNPHLPTAVATQITCPHVIEEMETIGSTTYAACADGVYAFVGNVLSPINTDFFKGTHPSSIVGTSRTLFVGNGTGGAKNKLVARSDDAGVTWRWLPVASLNVLGAQPAREWWLKGKYPDPTGNNASVSQLALDTKGRLYASGRGGMLIAPDGEHLQVGSHGLNGSDCGPQAIQGSKVWTQDTDYTSFATSDRGLTVVQDMNPPAMTTHPLKQNVAGHTYELVEGSPRDFLVDGKSVATPFFQAATPIPAGYVVDADGVVYVSLNGGGLLVGAPA